jgi:hypothetical protein
MERAETDQVKYCAIDGTVLESYPYPIWEDTGASYCFNLVQHLLRRQYCRNGDTLQSIGTREKHPEMVCVVANDGRVICEWSVKDEQRLLNAKTQRR